MLTTSRNRSPSPSPSPKEIITATMACQGCSSCCQIVHALTLCVSWAAHLHHLGALEARADQVHALLSRGGQQRVHALAVVPAAHARASSFGRQNMSPWTSTAQKQEHTLQHTRHKTLPSSKAFSLAAMRYFCRTSKEEHKQATTTHTMRMTDHTCWGASRAAPCRARSRRRPAR